MLKSSELKHKKSVVKDADYYRALLTLTILENPYIPHDPHPKQAQFLMLDCLEAFFGGAAGGGKSDALLMSALQYVTEPNYHSLILRRSYKDLALPGAIMDRAQEWLTNTDAVWDGSNYSWRFPNGASMTFGYLETDKDKYRYLGSEFQFIAYDELTQFTEEQYRYLFSRLRTSKEVNLPLRLRSASNPGNVGHRWVKQRFIIEGEANGRVFIPSKVDDNPSLDAEEYSRSLAELDPLARAQLRDGDWNAAAQGDFFQRDWFHIIDELPESTARMNKVRYWDMASTEYTGSNDPDFTAGVLMGEREGRYYVLDVKHFRSNPKDTQDEMVRTAFMDGRGVDIYIEQEGGSSGKTVIDNLTRVVFKGFSAYGDKPTCSKASRAKPLSSACRNGNVFLLQGNWINDFLDEMETFNTSACNHEDIIDASSGAHTKLSFIRTKVSPISLPKMSKFRGF